jgi:hypothetical protein
MSSLAAAHSPAYRASAVSVALSALTATLTALPATGLVAVLPLATLTSALLATLAALPATLLATATALLTPWVGHSALATSASALLLLPPLLTTLTGIAARLATALLLARLTTLSLPWPILVWTIRHLYLLCGFNFR